MPLHKLLDESDSNETGQEYTHKGGPFLFGVDGVTDGATVSLQGSWHGDVWTQVGDGTSDAQFADDTGQMNIDLGPSPCRLRVVTTGGNEDTQSITAWVATAR